MRLVDAVASSLPEASLDRAARQDISRENHAARIMGPEDARVLLAREVEASIEGGRAAIIRPEVRRRLVSRAQDEGLRPFDANLIIAIVQDAAREGESLAAAPSQRLALVPAATDERIRPLAMLAASVCLGTALLLGAIAWLSA